MTQEEFLTAFDSKERGFEMFTKTGNKKAQAITRRLIKKIFGKKKVTREEIIDLAGKLIAKAYLNKKTSEILDSEPPYHISHYVRKALDIAGYNYEINSYDITDDVWSYVKQFKGEK
jgi:hypothetical protein